LQVLQDQEFQRLGGKDTIKVDVRVIAATHRDLERAIADGHFREDLFYRLNVINLKLPPLRERQEDIQPMAEFLLRKHTQNGTMPLQLPSSLKDLFQHYHWPGNVRELENVVRKFLVLRDSRMIEQDLRAKLQRKALNGHNGVAAAVAMPLEPTVAAPPSAAPVGDLTPMNGTAPVLEQVAREKREAERLAIIAALKATNWNRKQAALMLQIDYKALLYKMNRLSIKKEKATARAMPARAEAAVASGQQASGHNGTAVVRVLG
jgi:two-component system, NtrC family, response regulator AtoC